NGRYRFFDVMNGEYDIVVEVENHQAARIRVNLIDRVKTDIRQDLALEWRARPGSGVTPKAGSVSAEDVYKRQPENETRFNKSQDASKRKDYKVAAELL